jgi:hypothetical protein
MTQSGRFDPTFDFRTDAEGGDPDSTSPTLRAYHKLLWSKPLPTGDPFELDDSKPLPRLHHVSSRGEFDLTSDSAVQTWSRPGVWPKMQAVIAQIPEPEKEHFLTVAHQIGGKVIFPIDSKPTINQARGMNPAIADRFDLTLECIRLHYLGETSPLAETLIRYGDFFALFDDFSGYTDFFLFQDLVTWLAEHDPGHGRMKSGAGRAGPGSVARHRPGQPSRRRSNSISRRTCCSVGSGRR